MSKSQNNWAQYQAEQTQGGAGEIGAIVDGIVSRIQTVTLVRIIKTKAGGLAPVGMVDVQPLVSQINGSGEITPHGIIYNIPYFRLQGGGNAVIIDPKPGDIGMCGFCSRDISSVKQNKAPSAPQSRRRYDFSDGLYFGGFLNGTPQQYIHFKDGGIKIYSPDKVEIEAPQTIIKSPDVQIDGAQMTIKANTTQTGSFEQTGGGQASFSGSLDLTGTLTTGGDAVIGGKSFLNHTNNGLPLD